MRFSSLLTIIAVSLCSATNSFAATLEVAIFDPLAKDLACPCVKGYAQRDYNALASHLHKNLHTDIHLSFATSLTQTIKDIGRKPDILIGKKAMIQFDAAQARLPMKLLAMLTGLDGTTTQRGLFVVRASDVARSIADLRGRTIIFGTEDSEEKYAAALATLKRFDVPVPQPVLTAATCNNACADLLDNKADAAVISSYALPLVTGCGAIPAGSMKVVGETATVPFIGVFVNAELPDSVTTEFVAALREANTDATLKTKLESRNGFEIVPPTDRDQPRTGWIDWRGSSRRDGICNSVPSRLPSTARFLWRQPLYSQSLGGIAATETFVILSDKANGGQLDSWRCFDSNTGKQVWEVTNPAPDEMDYTNAPRACPVIAGDVVYLLGAFGHLHCVHLANGKSIWTCNILKRFGGSLPQWGFSGTPIIDGDRLILQSANSLIALNRENGDLIWQTSGRKTAYSSLLMAKLGDKLQLIGYDAKTAGGWDAQTGKRLWELEPAEASDFNVPTPVLVNDKLLLATENNGTRLYAFNGDGTPRNAPVAQNDNLSPHTSTPLFIDGVIWGACDKGLYCLDAANGLKIIWKNEEPPFNDHTSLIAGNKRVLVVTKGGKIALLPTRPDPTTRAELLTIFHPQSGFDPEVWSHPALVGNRLYLRSQNEIACVTF